MRLRKWLLTGTSLGILALAPTGFAKAQDAALIDAFNQYIAASSSDDADAKANAESALQAACEGAGISNIDDCIAQIQSGSVSAPPHQPRPQRPHQNQRRNPLPRLSLLP